MGKRCLSHHVFPPAVTTCGPLAPAGAGGMGYACCVLTQQHCSDRQQFSFSQVGKSASAATWLLLPGTALNGSTYTSCCRFRGHD